MGGRGRGGGGSLSARNVANALGIARHDMARMMAQQKVEPPPLYPKVKRDPIPIEMNTDNLYISRLKMELDQRLRSSEFYIEKPKQNDIKRYLDKYSVVQREKLEIDMDSLPSELNWKRAGKTIKKPEAKRRKLDDKAIDEKLKRLEAKEGEAVNEDDEEEKKKDDDDAKSEKSEMEDPENPLSDDDYQEEDNDYISNYFDNGEGYGDGGSDDNMDGDEF